MQSSSTGSFHDRGLEGLPVRAKWAILSLPQRCAEVGVPAASDFVDDFLVGEFSRLVVLLDGMSSDTLVLD